MKKNLRALDIKKLEEGFGGIRFPHVKVFDSVSFKDHVLAIVGSDWLVYTRFLRM